MNLHCHHHLQYDSSKLCVQISAVGVCNCSDVWWGSFKWCSVFRQLSCFGMTLCFLGLLMNLLSAWMSPFLFRCLALRTLSGRKITCIIHYCFNTVSLIEEWGRKWLLIIPQSMKRYWWEGSEGMKQTWIRGMKGLMKCMGLCVCNSV